VNVVNVNNPPTANAGADQSVGENSMVTLDGSLSRDADGDSLTLLWSQISGPAVQLDDASVVNHNIQGARRIRAEGVVDISFNLW
jgi:hypothetical protein